MQINPVPDAVSELVDAWPDGGMVPQPPISWPRDSWLETLPDSEAMRRFSP